MINMGQVCYSSTISSRLCVFLLLCNCCCEGLVVKNVTLNIPAILAFGDSTVDQGNNNVITTIMKSNFKPYGKDFPGGIPTGRFCNGKTPPDFIAEWLGIKELIPAYNNNSNLKAQDLSTGVSFASGGSGYDPQTSKLWNVLSLSDQLDQFKEYIGKLKRAVGEEGTNHIVSKSLYLVAAGTCDFGINYFFIGTRRAQYDLPSYIRLLVSSASTFIEALYKLGARRFAVLSMPPIGCFPSERTLSGGSSRMCAEKYNEAAQLFNSKLEIELKSLNKTKLPQSKVVYIDIYNPLLYVIQQPHKYGFEFSDKGCCGTGDIEVVILCNKYSGTCEDDSKYVLGDSFHPTERTYSILMDQILEKYIDNLV